MDVFNPAFWTFVAIMAGIYVVLALGLYVQFSLAGLPNFGHVAFMAVAAYTMAILVVRAAMPLPVAAIFGLVAAVALGCLLGIPSVRLRADYLAIASVAAGEMVRYLATNLSWLTGGPLGSVGLLGPARFVSYNAGWQDLLDRLSRALSSVLGSAATPDRAMLLVVWSLAGALLWVFRRLERSPWGRVLRAIREDETAATAVGKHVAAFKLQALLLGAALGGLAGLLLAWQIGVFSPNDFEPTLTFYAYLILIFGGMNRLWAIPVGAAVFSLLYTGTQFLTFFPLSLVDSGSRAFLRLFSVGFLLVLFMMIRPQGLLGNRRELLLEK